MSSKTKNNTGAESPHATHGFKQTLFVIKRFRKGNEMAIARKRGRYSRKDTENDKVSERIPAIGQRYFRAWLEALKVLIKRKLKWHDPDMLRYERKYKDAKTLENLLLSKVQKYKDLQKKHELKMMEDKAIALETKINLITCQPTTLCRLLKDIGITIL